MIRVDTFRLPMALWSGLLVLPAVAQGQVVRGELEEPGGAGLGGAMISLLDRNDGVVGDMLTDPQGAFQIVGVPGEFRVRADRIGHASTFSDWFSMAAGDTVFISLVAQVEAVRLEGIDVEGDRRCRVRPEEGLAVTRVWDEARKALAAAAWTQDRGLYRYEMMNVRRSLDRDGRRVLGEDRDFKGGYARAPYVALPTEQLIDEGFASFDSNGMSYYAPDASVLLSDAFLDTHCFRLRQGEDESEGLIGLGFEPIRGRGVPEIDGTLWIDPATSLLRWLDYRYRDLDLPDALMTGLVGGKVEFSALPNGTWIVNSWRIQMPTPGYSRNPITRRMQAYLDGYSVQGGQVLRIHGEAGVMSLDGTTGSRIVGAVFDSLRTGGLQGAEVFIPGTDVSAVTGFDGRFTLGGLAPGVYPVTFRHPYLDPFSYVPEPYDVEVGVDTVAQITFLAPPRRRVLDELCRGVPRPEESSLTPGRGVHPARAIVLGRVTDDDGLPILGATVRVMWREWRVDFDAPGADRGERVEEGRLGTTVLTDDDGQYRLCWVPADIPLDIAALESMDDLDPGRQGTFWTFQEAENAREGLFTVPGNLQVGTRNLTLRRSRVGVLEGRITADEDGSPLVGASVHLRELGVTVSTDADGSFSLDAAPVGELSLEINAAGRLGETRTVTVEAGGRARVDVSLSRSSQVDG